MPRWRWHATSHGRPHAVAYSKELIGLARGVPRSAALAVERERFVDLFDTNDPGEGVAAFSASARRSGTTTESRNDEHAGDESRRVRSTHRRCCFAW